MTSPTIGRRAFLKTVGGLSASALLSPAAELSAAEPTAPSRKPNFLVVVADDQCFRTLHALNNREVQTPAFDRLLARGTAFTHCFHQGSWTGAVCVASRAMLHTGRHVWTCGGNDCGYHPLLGEALQMGGYDTYVVGKWHNGDQTALRSFTTGKTIGPGFYASTPENGLAYDRPRPGDPWTPWDPKYRGHWTPNKLWDIEHPAHDGVWISQKGPSPEKAGPHYERRQHSCELYADSAVELLRQTASRPDRPFFLYVAWNSPHDPRQAPKEFVDRYPADKIEVPPNFLPQHPFDQGDFHVRDEMLAPFPRTPYDVQVHRREYYASITFMDGQLGRILDALGRTGQADNTCVIVTGDHGLAVGEHGLMGKQNLYDCSVRMPFIMAGPGIAAGRRLDAMMYQHCLFPTLCDLAGIPTPATVQFPSLLPLLRGERARLIDSIYSAYRRFQRMVRTEQYKLILYPDVKRVQLFDIQKDPWEMKNLADESSHAATVAELFRELKKWQGTVNDQLALDPAAFGIPS
ncbi:MAG: sulfatase-like hydrolase/transferase [Verrucomicrobiota bacterium]|nr:sulfatase-like hydrolase/transferase [Verrucomicrobiota bacterium]